MDISNAELPLALMTAGMFHFGREDWEGAYTTYSRLLKLQETTDTADSLGVKPILIFLYYCATKLGRSEEAAEFERRADAIMDNWFTLILSSCFGVVDDAADDNVNGRISKWCVDDSASERVFIPDGKSTPCCSFFSRKCVAAAAQPLNMATRTRHYFLLFFVCFAVSNHSRKAFRSTGTLHVLTTQAERKVTFVDVCLKQRRVEMVLIRR